MKFIIKLFPEITIKSRTVRLRFIKILTNNIRNILIKIDKTVTIVRCWDCIKVFTQDKSIEKLIIDSLVKIPGIHHVLLIEDYKYNNIHDIFEYVLERYRYILEKKTFCVRVKRRGIHNFNSLDVERYVGGKLNEYIGNTKVQLKQPDVTINIEIEKQYLTLIMSRYKGIGGFPIGTQEDVLSLISGGFDSSISSYMLIRRGNRVHYCCFNFGGISQELIVRQVAYHLWYNFGSSHNVMFITTDFNPIINELFKKIKDSQRGVILKRMMIRVASKIAKRYSIRALVTGEVLGQVSSQTLTNLHLIDNISDMLILRPLISNDKEDIINVAHEIGTAKFVKNSTEYCSVISKKPIIKGNISNIEIEESKFDFDILDNVASNSYMIDLRKFHKKQFTKNNNFSIEKITEIVSSVTTNDIILDIRTIDEQENKPLQLTIGKIQSMPFYNIRSNFHNLDQSKTWLLYCTNGLISKLQLIYLREQGYTNVKIYRPLK